MPLVIPKYRVYLNPTEDNPTPDPEGVVVEIRHADQLRGELEAGKQGLPPIQHAAMNHTTVWVWCAMARLGLYAGEFRQFKLVDLAGLEAVRDETGEPVLEPVDPTRPEAASGSA